MHRVVLKILSLLCIAITAQAYDPAPYWGLDYKHRIMEGTNRETSHYREVFQKGYHGIDLYFGARIRRNIGMELGFEQTLSESKEHTFVAGENFLGDTQAAGDKSSMKARTHVIHLDVHGLLDLTDNLDAITQLGIGVMRAKVRGSMFVAASGETVELEPSGSYSVIPRAGVGVQYKLTRNFGARALVSLDATNLLALTINDEDGSRQRTRPFRSSISASLGLYFYL